MLIVILLLFGRVPTFTGLHILELGKKHIKVTDAVKEEIARLAYLAHLRLCYTPMYATQKSEVSNLLVFQNARSLQHSADLSADQNLTASDITTVAETRLTARDSDISYTIDDQQQISANHHPHGQVLY